MSAKQNQKQNQKLNNYICKDITKHPEYKKVLSIKDKSIQQRMIKCLENKYKNGFDIRQFTQSFNEENKTYVIVKYETKERKDPKPGQSITFNILYDEKGFKYFSKDKIDKFITEKKIPNEINETSIFTITTSNETFFMKDGEPVFYIPIECSYINGDEADEDILLDEE